MLLFTSTHVFADSAPAAISDLTAFGRDGQVYLNWTEPDDGDSEISDYLIEYSLSGQDSYSQVIHDPTTENNFTISGLVNGTKYDFRVEAINAVGTASSSNIVSATPLPLIFTDTFDGLNNGAVSGQNGWTAGNMGTWSVGSDGGSGKLVGQTATTGTRYYYRDYISNGDAGYGDQRLVTDFKVVANTYQPQFWFRKTATSGDAGGYLIFYNAQIWTIAAHTAASGDNFTTLATINSPLLVSNGTWYTAEIEVINDADGNPVINLTAYLKGETPTWLITYTDTSKAFSSGYFAVGAASSNQNNQISYDNVYLYSVPVPVTPDTVSNLSAYGQDGKITLNWTAPDGNGYEITDYTIEYKLSSSATWTTFEHEASVLTTVEISGLTNNSSYDFRVSAINQFGTGSVSNTANTRPLADIFTDNFDALNNGVISGQNGWTLGGEGAWTVGSDGGSGKIVSQTADSGYHFYLNTINNGSETYSNQRLKVDFNDTTTPYQPQFWLRKTANTGNAGGYLVFFNNGDWIIAKHAAGTTNYTSLKTTDSPIAINTGTWYTAEVEAIDNASGNPVIRLYVYTQGGTRPAQPSASFTDTTNSYLTGYIGLGGPSDPIGSLISYDNLTISSTDTQALTITSPAHAVSGSPNVATKAISDEGGTFYIPYIQTSDDLNVIATVGEAYLPNGGGVKFVLNEGEETEQILYDLETPFSVTFPNLDKGTYSVNTYVVDSDQVVQEGLGKSDFITDVGIGDIITCIGDSITAGYPYGTTVVTTWLGAAVGSDSIDNRNFNQHDPYDGTYRVGYLRELNNTLTTYFGYPVFLMNEGIGAYRTSHYVSLMAESQWQDRQTDLAPNKWLIHLGVNDANNSVTAATYKTNMNTIINTLINTYNANQENIYIAKPFYIQNKVSAQNLEASYSTKIDELISTYNLTSGPNFYSYYAPYGATLYSGTIHPNTAGYTQMARLYGLSMMKTQNLNVSQSSGTVTLSWNDLSLIESSVAGYKVKYGTTSGNYSTIIDVGDVLTTQITDLVDGETYYFVVSAYDNDANFVSSSMNSAEVNSTINESTPTPTSTLTPTPIPSTAVVSTSGSTSTNNGPVSAPSCNDSAPSSAPMIYQAIAKDANSVILSFTKAGDPVDKYVLEYGTSSGSYQFGEQNIDPKNIMSYQVSFLTPNTTYYFRIRGGNGCATGAWSNEISVKTKKIISINQLKINSSELIPIVKDDNQVEQKSEISISEHLVKVKVVNDFGKPVEGATIILHSEPKTAVTNKDGVAEFNNVENGDHKLVINYKGYNGEESINLEGNVEEFNLNVTVKPQNILLSPAVLGIIALLLSIIVVLSILLIKAKKNNL